jgi:hypothetical protein
MKRNAYEDLLEEQRAKPELGRLREAERLAEIARNLESLGKLADAAEAEDAEERERDASPVDPQMTREAVPVGPTGGSVK